MSATSKGFVIGVAIGVIITYSYMNRPTPASG